jgi:hypothetical protein
MGSVDLFGLDEFGQPTGSLWQYGAVIGAVTQTGGAMLFRNVIKNEKAFKYSEILGAGVSAVAGAALYFMGERTAGMSAGLSGLVSGGLRQLEFNTLMDKMKALTGFGYAAVDKQWLVPGSAGSMGDGLGLATVEQSPHVYGASLGGQMPNLVGDYGLSANPAANSVQLQGGPTISGLGGHYGATLFSS